MNLFNQQPNQNNNPNNGNYNNQPQAQNESFLGFGKKENSSGQEVVKLVEDVRRFSSRIRSTEERMNKFRRNLQLNEQTVLDINKKVNEDVGKINSDILDLKHDMSKIKSKMEMMIKEFSLVAKKEELDVVSKYLDLWKPIDFVTQNEVKKIVKQVLLENGLDIKKSESNMSSNISINDDY